MAVKILSLAIAVLALLFGPSPAAAEPRCSRGASFHPSTRMSRTAGGPDTADPIQILQPWTAVIKPPVPRSAHSVLFEEIGATVR